MAELVFEGYPVEGWPITGRFGQTEGYGYPHRGTDIGCPTGTLVRAPAEGVVTTHRPGDGWGDGSFGNCVILDHEGTPYYSLYAHLQSFLVSNGERVGAGFPLGTSNNTGKSTGSHLHWQVCLDPWFGVDIARSRDPESFIRQRHVQAQEADMTPDEVRALIREEIARWEQEAGAGYVPFVKGVSGRIDGLHDALQGGRDFATFREAALYVLDLWQDAPGVTPNTGGGQ